MKRLATAGLALSGLLLSTATFTFAQQTQTTIKKTTVSRTSAASGQEMFNAYCAPCHGKDAKGTGPAVPALKVLPPDLTVLSVNHGGKYPAEYVESVLKFGAEGFPAHGTKDMPIWGPVLGSISGGTTSSVTALRIYNISKYIESLQGK